MVVCDKYYDKTRYDLSLHLMLWVWRMLFMSHVCIGIGINEIVTAHFEGYEIVPIFEQSLDTKR